MCSAGTVLRVLRVEITSSLNVDLLKDCGGK